MQKQIQEQRQLTFEDINPEWNQIIADAGGYTKLLSSRATMAEQVIVSEKGSVTITNLNVHRNLGNYSKCIVGEPHYGY